MASFFWGELTRLEWVSLSSFVKQGFKVELYVCEDMRVPEGVHLRDAGEFIDCDNILLYGSGAGTGAGSPSLTSNIFRYKLLAARQNTCWIDTDMICVNEFELDENYIFAYERPGIINSAILGVGPAGDCEGLYKLLSSYVDKPFKLRHWDDPKVFLRKLVAKLKMRTDWKDVPWGVTGPQAVTSAIKHLELLSYAKTSKEFYPISYANAGLSFCKMEDDMFESLFLNAKTYHLWNEVLRRMGSNKNIIFHPMSPYERLISKDSLDSGFST